MVAAINLADFKSSTMTRRGDMKRVAQKMWGGVMGGMTTMKTAKEMLGQAMLEKFRRENSIDSA